MKKLLLMAAVICLIPLIWFGMITALKIYRWVFHPFFDQEISGPLLVSKNWLEITPKESLRPERQINDVVVDVQDDFEPDYDASGLRQPDGSVVTMQVELVDENGGIHRLTSSAIYQHGLSLSLEALPTDQTYRTVRIRATGPLRVRRIFWHCYNTWDVS